MIDIEGGLALDLIKIYITLRCNIDSFKKIEKRHSIIYMEDIF